MPYVNCVAKDMCYKAWLLWKICTKCLEWDLLQSSSSRNLWCLPSLFPLLFLIINSLQGWAFKESTENKLDQVPSVLGCGRSNETAPTSWFTQLLVNFYSIIPTPHPNTGQPANLWVGHLPTWKTNLRKCQRIGIRDRTGGRGGVRGNG